jgi:hypothetical protein
VDHFWEDFLDSILLVFAFFGLQKVRLQKIDALFARGADLRWFGGFDLQSINQKHH